ncbi:MAG TPA: membrane protein insertase YidC [Streptosporangiaceae bacterium]|nr:membrane protein insertase YidC [Streptosporangiaceae bacterium]
MTLDPLYRAVAWVIVQIHHGLSFIFPADSGAAWAGSIILLTVLMRILIFPLFVKQINASRKMQELNPQVQALRKKYKNDKQRMNQEVMKLYQEAGANPLSGCLPLLVQFPVFISLFNVLNKMANAKDGNGSHGISAELVESAQNASIFGASISDKFLDAWGTVPKDVSGLIVTGIAVIISSVTTYFSVKVSMARQPAMEPGNPMATAQKMMVYLAPIFAIFGLGFPLGVLLYWMTSNTWTLAQTHYIHKRYPINIGASQDTAASNGQRTGKSGKSGKSAPAGGKATGKPTAKTTGHSGGAAGKTGKAGKADQTTPAGGLLGRRKKQPAPEPEPEPESKPKVIRQQPVRQSRSKRSGGSRKR